MPLVTYDSADDIYCEGNATTQNFAFVIAASVTLTGPASPLLYRDPDGGSSDLTFTYDINPGAGSYGFAWAYDAKFGAKGAIVGDYPKGDYGERGGGLLDGKLDDLRFPRTLKLMGPFDWSESPGITGGRGRTHVIGAQVFEPGVVGRKVSVLLAKRSGKFKPFVSKTIPSTRKLLGRTGPPVVGRVLSFSGDAAGSSLWPWWSWTVRRRRERRW
jgi:hypothetical protein